MPPRGGQGQRLKEVRSKPGLKGLWELKGEVIAGGGRVHGVGSRQ